LLKLRVKIKQKSVKNKTGERERTVMAGNDGLAGSMNEDDRCDTEL